MPAALKNIGKYEILSKIGEGGMGVVYKARHTLMDNIVAIKMMTVNFAENVEYRERFEREARSLAKFNHDNIVRVYDMGDLEGAPYLVMEFLEGTPLDKLIATRASINLVQKLDYIIQVCSALNYAHQKEIIHRDIKPANVIVLEDGTGCKVVDFGIARAAGGSGKTATGMALGTIAYMSPQQIKAKKDLDGRTDIFSTGVMLYQLLTGALPWDAEEQYAIAIKILTEPYPPLSTYISDYPPGLDAIVEKALAKEADDRYSTAEDFGLDLAQVQHPLKSALIKDYVVKARECMAASDVTHARELVSQVLHLDPQQSDARKMMKELQEAIQAQARGSQVSQLRISAEQAIGQHRFDDALRYVDQAIRLDKTNAELAELKKQISQGLALQEQVRKKLQLAEAAQKLEDLQTASDMVEKALELDPTDTQARMMQAALSRRMSEHTRDKQVKELSDAVRREMAAHNYTAANDLVGKLEEINPELAELDSLKKQIVTGHDQEVRRRKLEQVATDAQKMLSAGNITGATKLVADGLQEFPGEPSLLQLQKDAQTQREKAEREKFIDDQVTTANRLLNEQKPTEALRIADEIASRFPAEKKVQSLLSKVRDTAGQQRSERRKQQLLSAAQASIQAQRFDEAIETLEGARIEFPAANEFVDMLRLAREHVSRQREAAAQAIAQSVRRMLDQGDFAGAIAKLEDSIQQTPDSVLEQLLSQARQGAAEHETQIRNGVDRAQQLLKAGDPNKAVTFLDGLPPLVRKVPQIIELRSDAVRQADQIKKLAKPLEKVKGHMDRGEFSTARDLLLECMSQVGEITLLRETATRIDQAELAFATTSTNNAIQKSQELLKSGQAAQAVAALETANPWLQFVDAKLRQKWEAAHKDAQKEAAKKKAAPAPPPAAKPEAGGATKMYSVAGLEQALGPAPVTEAPAKGKKEAEAPPSGATSILTSDNLQQALAAAAAGEAVVLPPEVRKAPPPAAPKPGVRPEPKPAPKPEAKPAAKAEPKVEPKVEVKAEPKPKKVEKPVEKPEPRVAPVAHEAPPHVAAPPVHIPAPAPEPSSKKWIGIGAAVAVVVIGVGIYFAMSGGKGKGTETAQPETTATAPAPAATAPTPTPAAPAPSMGTLSIEAKDDKGAALDGADVFVDNQLKDVQVKGGRATIKLAPGSHQVRIEKRGFETSAVQRIAIAKDAEASLQFALKAGAAAAPPPNPYLMFTSTPGATVKIDSKTMDNVGPDGKASFQVPPGAHKVDIAMRGFQPWSNTVSAKAGERVPVSAVLTPVPPPGVNFSTSTSSIQEGQSAELKWDTQNATEVTIDGQTVGTSGSKQVSPKSTTTYTLIAKGEGQPTQKAVIINVAAIPKPAISAFSASATSIQKGSSTRLQWATDNANDVSIEGIGKVEPRGSREVSPADSTTYRLTAKGPGGSVDSQPVRITVEAAPPPRPTAPAVNPDIALVQAVLDTFQSAYQTKSIPSLEKAWPTIPAKTKDALAGSFKLNSKFAMNCKPASVTGDTAQTSCSQVVSMDGKAMPAITISLELQKASGAWHVTKYSASQR